MQGEQDGVFLAGIVHFHISAKVRWILASWQQKREQHLEAPAWLGFLSIPTKRQCCAEARSKWCRLAFTSACMQRVITVPTRSESAISIPEEKSSPSDDDSVRNPKALLSWVTWLKREDVNFWA